MSVSTEYTNTPRHAATDEAWITARAILNRGWFPRPRHAVAGRRGVLPVYRRTLAAIFA